MNEFIDIPQSSDPPLSMVLNSMRLEPISDGVFHGTSISQLTSRIYGGQVFAQAVMAAAATLHGAAADRAIHSITAAFLRPGDTEIPVRFEVEDVLDGRSFSTRRILAYQNGNTIFSARASFQEIQPGVEHHSSQPEAPDPDTLPSSIDLLKQLPAHIDEKLHAAASIDLRHVGGAIWTEPAPTTDDHTLIWLRLRTPVPPNTSQLVHRALLAFATDQFMLEPVMRKHSMYWLNPDCAFATLDHAIWWHRDVSINDWILAELVSPSAQGGRGLSLARYYQDGVHIATMAQEGMIRLKTLR